jgi:hypothetical protein
MGRLTLLIATITIVIAAPALAVPQPDAEEAYARGDYATAFKLWLPLAEQGSARAQANIARMYERGEWVAQDPAMASEWYRRSAEQSAQDAAMSGAPAQQVVAPPVQSTYTPLAAPPSTASPSRPAPMSPVFYSVPLHHHHGFGGRRH